MENLPADDIVVAVSLGPRMLSHGQMFEIFVASYLL